MTSGSAADLVLRGGRIATMDAARPWAEAVAVAAGAITLVGSDADVRAHIGTRTRVIELRGRTVTPGFQDAHVHAIQGGLARLSCDLSDLRGVDAYAAAVDRYAREHPAVAWIRGEGWSMSDFPGGIPHRSTLDTIVPDRPVRLWSRDGHTAWVNSRALALAGITADTPDPAHGRIERDPDGTPGGALQEGAVSLVTDLEPPWSDDELLTGGRIAQQYLHSLGITAWQDASVDPDREERAYPALAAGGELTARVVGALHWDAERGEDQVESLVERRARTSGGRYQATSVKFFVDGVLENLTGSLLEPYTDAAGNPTGERGMRQYDPDDLGRYATQLDALGFQCHFHVIGDRAARDMLDAVEAARRANGPSDTRPTAAHIQLIHPDDIPRFATLGVIPNAQAAWACHEAQMDELTIPFLGDRWRWIYPFGSLVRAGARLAMGSDWSVSTPDPLRQIEVAVERVDDEQRGQREPFLPEERLGLDDALRAFTLGSAHANHLDDISGSIEVGKRADLAVLDRDLFDRDAGPIGECRVTGTFVDGVPVFEDSALDD